MSEWVPEPAEISEATLFFSSWLPVPSYVVTRSFCDIYEVGIETLGLQTRAATILFDIFLG